MKEIIVRFWLLLTVLLCLFMFFLLWLDSVADFLDKFYGCEIFGVLTFISFLFIWIVLLFNKSWLECFISVFIFVLFFCLWVVVILVLAFSNMPRTDKFESRHPIPDGVEYSMPLDSESCSISAD